jgi:8-oxo-dGTP pyrophosphatase MutT (NUDIX family)
MAMVFNFEIGTVKADNKTVKVNYREAVRAVIIKDNNVLMVNSNKGDYKFPGGGMENGETHEQTAKREVQEETGYIIDKVQEKIGVIIERNIDTYEKGAIFEMTSHYYLCEVTDKTTFQQLDAYEAELEFCPKWINIDKAIENNEAILKKDDKNEWVYRENLALKSVRKVIIR